MKKSIISVRPNSVFTAFKYISQPCQIYKLWQVVFKESEVEFKGNPIGVVIQIYGNGDSELRADMYDNVCYTEIRPATYAEIKQYCPDLLPNLQLVEYLQALKNELVGLKETALTSEGRAKLTIQKRIRFCENEADSIIYSIQEAI